ncbi:YdcF family protein [Allorhizobium sonneratiae]|uniref:YdcF family protein n=1 Tax=Allorhizobium sonneratiae TaxID=2934936 RepID=UPI003B8471BE
MNMRHRKTETEKPGTTAQGFRRLFNRKDRLRRLLRFGGYVVILLVAGFIGGFLHFADMVSTMKPPVDPKADAIVVLTGGYQRIDQAVDLLRRGAGKRLLISGVHPTTTPAQIRRMTQSSADLFACCVDMGYEAIDTIGNANETERWIHDKGYKSVLVVTSNYHIERSLMELRRIDHQTHFIPYPVVNGDLLVKAWYTDPNALRTLLSEYAKIIVASLRDRIGWGAWQGLRSPADVERSQKHAFAHHGRSHGDEETSGKA